MQQCTTKNEIVNYIEQYMEISEAEQQEVVEITGCKLPCTYMEYLDGGEKIYKVEEENNQLTFVLAYATTQVTRKEEVYMYPFRSFLAEFGGALGLFLGFSFLTVWD